MTWTLTLTPATWLAAVLILFIGGKLLQQGGRMYGEGKNWQLETLTGIACYLYVILGSAFTLIAQNTPD